MKDNNPTKIWAHRGSSAYSPENTLDAFMLAIQMKADGIELDVHMTSDGKVVVSHDGTIDRCSDGRGKISEMTYTQLLQYNYSAGFRDKYNNVKIPLLYEVYDLIRSYDMTVNVEIKANGDEFIEKIYEIDRNSQMSDRIIYSSFNHFSLVRMKEINPSAFIAPLYGEGIVKPWVYANSFGAKALHPQYNEIYRIENYVKSSHEAGIRVHPWTVDGENDIKKLIDLGVDAIITNRPDAAVKIRDNS